MKIVKLVLAAILAAMALAGCSPGSPTGRVVNYGLVKVPKEGQMLATPETPSGVTHIASSALQITTTTNRIPARLGVAFGVAFEITGLPLKDGDVVELMHVVTFPPITKPDRSVSTGFAYMTRTPVKAGAVSGLPSYSFDHQYELVPGTWQFEVKYAGKTMARQQFTVYRE